MGSILLQRMKKCVAMKIKQKKSQGELTRGDVVIQMTIARSNRRQKKNKNQPIVKLKHWTLFHPLQFFCLKEDDLLCKPLHFRKHGNIALLGTGTFRNFPQDSSGPAPTSHPWICCFQFQCKNIEQQYCTSRETHNAKILLSRENVSGSIHGITDNKLSPQWHVFFQKGLNGPRLEQLPVLLLDLSTQINQAKGRISFNVYEKRAAKTFFAIFTIVRQKKLPLFTLMRKARHKRQLKLHLTSSEKKHS